MLKGIDISYYQGNVDFSKIKEQFKFVIIRVALGDNIASQDDVKYKEYIAGCQKYNIPYAFYLISYAKRERGSESVQSEIEHMDRIAKQYNPFAIFYDMEIANTTYLGKKTLTNFAIKFCDYFKNKGYKAGVYANKNWFTNYLDYNTLKNRGYIIWLAHYEVDKPGLPCDIWQYSDKGRVNGINTNTTDLDIMYNNIIGNQSQSTQKPVDKKVNIYYQVETKEDGVLPMVKNLDDYAGWENHPIRYLAIKVDKGSIKYRVTTLSGRVLGWVTQCNIKDHRNGCAGNGEPISTVELYYYTPNNIRPYKKAKYKVNDYSWQYDLEKSNGQDGYAGVKGKIATKFQATIV